MDSLPSFIFVLTGLATLMIVKGVQRPRYLTYAMAPLGTAFCLMVMIAISH